MAPLRVGVIGAAGQMGSQVRRAVAADPDLEMAAAVDVGDDLQELVDAGAQVAVDFTTPTAVKANVEFCVSHGVHAVVGTTGLSQEDLGDIERWVGDAEANVFVAPNFAVGAVLMMSFAAQAAAHFETAEIVERHHERKLDAPSGTALRTAALMNEARDRQWTTPPDATESLGGSRGGDAGGVRIHSVRVPGSVAHQEVILGAPGETLTIRHDSLDRASFMPGVILAIKRVPDLRGLTVGLEKLLGI